jgi:hypothetical protein
LVSPQIWLLYTFPSSDSSVLLKHKGGPAAGKEEVVTESIACGWPARHARPEVPSRCQRSLRTEAGDYSP